MLESYHGSVVRRKRKQRDFSENNNNNHVQKAILSGRDLSLQSFKSNPDPKKEDSPTKILQEDRLQTKDYSSETKDLSPFQVPSLLSFESNFRTNTETRSTNSVHERRARRIAEAHPITDLITYEPDPIYLSKKDDDIQKKPTESETKKLGLGMAQRRNERLRVKRKGQPTLVSLKEVEQEDVPSQDLDRTARQAVAEEKPKEEEEK